ncbi:CST complex subunit STN1 [Merluccius polli]|uniref:CST complex subunit STN1 n=1 Tax=Merluccius polli TaxID=89951 RepID=A0AA47MAE4_MERPO|nr:CST complex subunit STN1 [Merluccius polli]
MDQGDEPPSVLWGLDPVFSAFARLYVKDLLQIQESCQVPGIYLYNSHPIYKVDVLGTVVYKREREDFFCYGGNVAAINLDVTTRETLGEYVTSCQWSNSDLLRHQVMDDGTGVINCLCWKNEKWKESDDPVVPRASEQPETGCFDPLAELKKLREAQRKRSQLEIGDTLRVRGPVKTSRQQREIMASTFYKVNDPVMAEQIAWMLEVPELYRKCYDKPFQLQANTTSGPTVGRVTRATHILKDFLKKKTVTKFRPYDVLDLLQPLVCSQAQTKPEDQLSDQASVAGPSTGQQLRQLLKESLQVLQDEGAVYRKVKSEDELYHVTEQDKDLLIAVKDTIREDSKREKYAEKGCHVLHILSAVRQRYSPNISKEALQLVLKTLECNSDIISTSNSHYTMFS